MRIIGGCDDEIEVYFVFHVNHHHHGSSWILIAEDDQLD